MTARRAIRLLAAIGFVWTLGACAAPDPDPGNLAATDVYEAQNRKIHQFNVELDRAVLRPVAQGYAAVTPTLARHLIGNGLSHLELPADFVNYLLQGRVDRALETLGRFTLNTVMGAGGLLDPATEFGLPRRATDFGVTMARHGAAEGAYLVVPLLGPKTGRDLVGDVVDLAFYPTTYLGFMGVQHATAVQAGTEALQLVERRASQAELVDELLYESPDSYVALRAVYLQHRRALVADEEAAAEALPDIFETETQ